MPTKRRSISHKTGIRPKSNIPVVSKPGTSKVRSVPDFNKLHQKWCQKLETGKACVKKPCTVPHEFGLTKFGSKVEYTPSRVINPGLTCSKSAGKLSSRASNRAADDGFRVNTRALASITSNSGISDPSLMGRATISSISTQQAKLKTSRGASRLRNLGPQTEKENVSTENLQSLPEEQGLEFEADDKALQSILDHVGVGDQHVVPPGGPPRLSSRTTLAGNMCKTPTKPFTHHANTVAGRRSIYYTGPDPGENSSKIYTDYFHHIKSRLQRESQYNVSSPAASKAPPAAASPFCDVALPVRHSIYKNYVHPTEVDQEMNTFAANTASCRKKAKRVAVTMPPKSPAVRINTPARSCEKTAPKWKDLLGPKHETNSQDPVKKTLTFQEEVPVKHTSSLDTSINTDAKKLMEMEDLERQLEMDILKMEQEQSKAHIIEKPAPQRDSDNFVVPSSSLAPSNTRNYTLPPPTGGTAKQRRPLGALCDEEIVERSTFGWTPHGGLNKNELKPVGDEITKTSNRQRTKSSQSVGMRRSLDSPLRSHSPNVKANSDSPKCRKYGQNNDSPLRSVLGEKHNSPYAKSPIMQYGSPRLEQQVHHVMEVLDRENKENMSPRMAPTKPDMMSPKRTGLSPRSLFSPKSQFKSPVCPGKGNVVNDLDLNQTLDDLNQSVIQYEALQCEAEVLESCEGGDKLIVRQLELIRQKQQELEKLQMTLQKQLSKSSIKTKQKKASSKTTSEKKTESVRAKTPVRRPRQTTQSTPSKATPSKATPTRGQIRTPGHIRTPASKRKRTPSMQQAINLGSAKKTLRTENAENKEVKVNSARALFGSQQGHGVSKNNVRSNENRDSGVTKLSSSSEESTSDSDPPRSGELTPTVVRSISRLHVGPKKPNLIYPTVEKPEPPVTLDATVPVFTPLPTKSPSGVENEDTLPAPIQTPLAMQAEVLRGAAYNRLNRNLSGSGSDSSPHMVPSKDRSPYCYYEDISPAPSSTNSPSYVSPPLGSTPRQQQPALTAMPHLHNSAMLSFISHSEQEKLTRLTQYHTTPVSSPHPYHPSPVPHPSYSDSLGSLSLAANVNSLVPQSPCQRTPGLLLLSAAVRFHEALLDEEVSLYACRLVTPQAQRCRDGSQNPIADVLQYGDDMHFIPVKDGHQQVPSGQEQVAGSAFSHYRNV